MVTSKTCEEQGWGRGAWLPRILPVSAVARTAGALLSSSIHTDHRNTHSPLGRVRETRFTSRTFKWLWSWEYYWITKSHCGGHTRGSEEGAKQLAVSGNLSDLTGDVDETTDHWGDSVEAQQPETQSNAEIRKTNRTALEAMHFCPAGGSYVCYFHINICAHGQAAASTRC